MVGPRTRACLARTRALRADVEKVVAFQLLRSIIAWPCRKGLFNSSVVSATSHYK